jgi:hypothetical protein
MELEIQTLQDIYSQFIRGKVAIDVAAQQVSEYTRLHKIATTSDQEKLEELYDHIALALADLEEHAEAK